MAGKYDYLFKTVSLDSDSNELKKKSAEEVIEDLKGIEQKYKNNDYVDAPDSLNLKKKNIEEKTDSDFEQLAKSTLDSKYNEKKKSTNDNFSSQIENLLKQNEQSKKLSEESKNQINSIYDESIKDTENNALKRGLARSSVIINQISSLEGGRASELANVINDLQSNLEASQAKMSELENQKNKALSDLDIEYALELEEEINKAKSEYEKQVNDAIEFNNNVDKLEAEYKLKLDSQKNAKQKQLSDLQSKGQYYTHNIIADKQYEYLKNYLDSLDKSYAYNLLATNQSFKEILGKDKYNELLEYVRSK